MVHPERLEDVVVDVALVRLAGDPLHDVAGQGGAVVRVRGNRTGGKQQRARVLLEISFRCLQAVWIQGDDVLQPLLEAAPVVHQVKEGDRLATRGRDFEVQVVIDIALQVEFALLDQLHDCRPGEEFGRRADPGHAPLRVHGDLLLDIRIAVARLEEDASVLHDRDDGPRNVAVLQPICQKAVEPGCNIRGGQLVRRVGGGRSAVRPWRRPLVRGGCCLVRIGSRGMGDAHHHG